MLQRGNDTDVHPLTAHARWTLKLHIEKKRVCKLIYEPGFNVCKLYNFKEIHAPHFYLAKTSTP